MRTQTTCVGHPVENTQQGSPRTWDSNFSLRRSLALPQVKSISFRLSALAQVTSRKNAKFSSRSKVLFLRSDGLGTEPSLPWSFLPRSPTSAIDSRAAFGSPLTPGTTSSTLHPPCPCRLTLVEDGSFSTSRASPITSNKCISFEMHLAAAVAALRSPPRATRLQPQHCFCRTGTLPAATALFAPCPRLCRAFENAEMGLDGCRTAVTAARLE